MYESLQLPWSNDPSPSELAYRQAGLVRTQGSIFLLPPDTATIITKFNALPRPRSQMSCGAVALCKHFERGGASSEHGVAHPFWPLPVGSNDNKTRLAAEVLTAMLSQVRWKNVMLLHPNVAVYEIRNGRGFGMRWTLDLSGDVTVNEADDTSEAVPQPSIAKVTFRGFLEPIVGADHELDD